MRHIGAGSLHLQPPFSNTAHRGRARTHTHRDTKTGRAAGGEREGECDPGNLITKQQQLLPVSARGRGCPGGIPPGSSPRSARRGGTTKKKNYKQTNKKKTTPRTTTTHNTTTSPAGCRDSKCGIWKENELKRLPPYSSSSSPRRRCHRLLLKKKKKGKKKKKKRKIQDTHTKQQQQQGERSSSAPRLLPPQLSSSHPSEPPCHRAGGGGEGGRTTTTTTTKTTQRICKSFFFFFSSSFPPPPLGVRALQTFPSRCPAQGGGRGSREEVCVCVRVCVSRGGGGGTRKAIRFAEGQSPGACCEGFSYRQLWKSHQPEFPRTFWKSLLGEGLLRTQMLVLEAG
ncbi:uncharacterized protein LOC142060444 isoform X3 [Phalacrocorax aristotelis]|uniref:uncharacterized protein LOC142060444 isoform X3 n=1 Tax=Phalacrocorax aristotelis TaxID=126867 RepID=UPI003F4B69DC